MNKGNRKEKQQPKGKINKRESKSQKETYLQWYERERRHSKLTFSKVAAAVILLIVCMVLAQEWTIAQLRDGASKYNEETYSKLKTVIEENVTNVAIDEKNIRESVDHYDVSWTKGGSTILTCDKEDGFFKAEARVALDIDPETGDYKITGSERNYHSVDEYLDYYWSVYRFMSYGLGLGVFFGIMIGWNVILWLVAASLRKIKAIKEKKQGEPVPSASAEENTTGAKIINTGLEGATGADLISDHKQMAQVS